MHSIALAHLCSSETPCNHHWDHSCRRIHCPVFEKVWSGEPHLAYSLRGNRVRLRFETRSHRERSDSSRHERDRGRMSDQKSPAQLRCVVLLGRVLRSTHGRTITNRGRECIAPARRPCRERETNVLDKNVIQRRFSIPINSNLVH